MAKVPFQRELEDLFASDQSIASKMIGGAFVGGLLFSLGLVIRDANGDSRAFPAPVKGTIVAGAAVVGMLVVLLLSLRDVVVRRVERGKPVNLLLRAYFGRGNGCLMVALWSVTVIVATLIVTMILAAL